MTILNLHLSTSLRIITQQQKSYAENIFHNKTKHKTNYEKKKKISEMNKQIKYHETESQ